MTQCSLIGIYRIIPTQKSISYAARYHRFDWLVDNRGEYIDEILWDNFENLGLIEIQVFGEYSPDMLMGISQGDQAPYMEFYLDPTGTHLVDEADAPNTEGRRVCFFLHSVDTSKPLQIGDRTIKLNEMSNLPSRLVPFTHYIPSD